MDLQARLEAMWRRKTREIIDAAKAEILASLPSFRGGRVPAESLGGTPPVSVQQTIDHGNLTGRADDDHTQYHNDARGDARYAPIAKGVTNGDTHDHAGGDGAQIDHGGLAGLADDDHTNLLNETRHDALDHTGLTGVGGGSLTVKEIDTAPSVAGVTEIRVTNGSLTDVGGGVVQLDFGSAATDGAAIHDNAASEIHAVTEKATPVDDDEVLVEDSEDGYAKKRVKVGNLPTGGGGTVTKTALVVRKSLLDTTLVSDSASVSLSSIPGTYDDLEIQVEGRLAASVVNRALHLEFNGDTTAANYRYILHIATEADHNKYPGDTQTWADIPGASAQAGSMGMVFGRIPRYAQTTFRKIVATTAAFRTGATTTRIDQWTMEWENTAAITSVLIKDGGGGNLLAGTRVRVNAVYSLEVVTDVT
jgi:hypothetical protein